MARIKLPKYTLREAVISLDGVYRYRLTRRWGGGVLGSGPVVTWVMLNPSTADGTEDDPTVRRVVAFSQRWGYGGLEVVNLFGLRATDPKQLWTAADPVGPDTDEHVAAALGNDVVVAWGAGDNGVLRDRAAYVLAMIRQTNRQPFCLGTTADGCPKHPLYVPGNVNVEVYKG